MHQQKNTHQASTHRSLAKSAIATAMTIAMGGSLTQVNAALPAGALLNFEPGVPVVTSCAGGNFTGTSCTIGGTPYTALEITDMGGSYFLMDQGQGNADKNAISQFAPLEIGGTQTSSGQHTGPVDGTESPAIDNAWNFFDNAGMHNLSSAITVSGAGATLSLDMSGWGVNWGEFGPGSPNPTIPMGGTATLVCQTDCSADETYTLDMDVHVPSGFPSVPYSLHLEGVIKAPALEGSPPVAVDDISPDIPNTIVGNKVTLDVLANDETPAADPILFNTLTPTTDTTNGGTTARVITNSAEPGYTEVDYMPPADFADDDDTFTYTVDNAIGGTSDPATVTVNVQTNVAPEAGDDLGSDGVNSNTGALTNAINSPDGGIIVKVLLNDTDSNNDDGLPGGIDTSSVNIIDQPTIGSCTKNPDGTITYSQALPAVGTLNDSCTYQISDIDDTNIPLTSDVTTVDINISELQSDWPPSLDAAIIPFLIYEDGVPNQSGNTADPPESGTFFSMDVSKDTTIHITLTKGPDGGFVIGYDQPAFGSHTGIPTGDEFSSVDLGWNFFGNTGLTFTNNGGIVGNPDGTLEFKGTPGVGDPPGQGRYLITWNGIPEIDLGGAEQFPEDLGFALISCAPAPCADGSTFDLVYEAHVPPGDPSGFGGVQYKLFMDGEVIFLDGRFQTSSGTFSAEERLTQDDVEPDPDSEIQCAGGCFDYTIDEVAGPTVAVVLPLNGAVPASTTGEVQLRVFSNGVWSNFDTSGANSVLSAPFIKGGDFGTTCPPPEDAAYVALTEGHQCMQVTHTGSGTVMSNIIGLGIPTVEPEVDNRKSDTSGCTIASAPVSPLQGGAWWLLAGLAAWMGWSRRKPQQH